ncbi:iron-containing alcohol dehydrogenase [Scopulibacillus cellulosilyticus]|uniref:Iron-containing alcohol dehydrogenase n=1 Tax=Scopulibacillus cellulosilyticus TaxID=2665665 RepID=A0ABW2Q5M4_9BACL
MSVLDLPRQIYIESGILNRLDEFVVANGGNRAFIIMDSFLVNSCHLDEKVKEVLTKKGLECTFFSNYSGEPTTNHVNDALEQLNGFHGNCIIGVGGGSAIDLAKAVSLFGMNPNMKWSDIIGEPRLNRLPLIAVPTTAGTGSEATKVMVITNIETNVKMNPGHPHLIPDAAILDPELTLSLPRNFTAYTGIDALTHAIEAYVSNRATPMSDLFALKAIRMISTALPKACLNGRDIEARKRMSLASCFAGIAFSNSSTNLAHAAGRPLGARFHIPHGLSVALLLPFVMRFGLDAAKERYKDIAVALGADPSKTGDLAESSIRIIEDFNSKFGIWADGQKYIQPQALIDAVPTLVTDAMSGNGISTNRKIPAYHDIAVIYNMLVERLSKTSTPI